ncbi:hypothetical protein [Prevotella sp.]
MLTYSNHGTYGCDNSARPTPKGKGRASLSNLSPNGEGSEDHGLQMKRGFLHIKESLPLHQRNAFLHCKRASLDGLLMVTSVLPYFSLSHLSMLDVTDK